jgi:tripeptide aminopeptidase
MLCDELKAMGLAEAHQDEHGLVWATIPSNQTEESVAILFNSHLDTSPEAPGDSVRPRVIENYDGGDISLSEKGQIIRVDQCSSLGELLGKTLIVTDGKTLLGGDDKAGVAAIMELAETLVENPSIPRGPVQILFTCDEEIGHGTQHIDWQKVVAKVAYTLDGGRSGEIDEETFSADMAVVRFIGRNIHPSIGKGNMVNAVRGAGYFLSQLPVDHLSPETTEDREGFIHPYDLQGGVGEAKLLLILRDFETKRLSDYRQILDNIAVATEKALPGLKISVQIQSQYRNMAEGLRQCPLAVDLAVQAHKNLGIQAKRTIVRGGTDGSMLTAHGLPTPNLSVGQYNIHSVQEFACLDEMALAVQHAIELVQLWSRIRRL